MARVLYEPAPFWCNFLLRILSNVLELGTGYIIVALLLLLVAPRLIAKRFPLLVLRGFCIIAGIVGLMSMFSAIMR